MRCTRINIAYAAIRRSYPRISNVSDLTGPAAVSVSSSTTSITAAQYHLSPT